MVLLEEPCECVDKLPAIDLNTAKNELCVKCGKIADTLEEVILYFGWFYKSECCISMTLRHFKFCLCPNPWKLNELKHRKQGLIFKPFFIAYEL